MTLYRQHGAGWLHYRESLSANARGLRGEEAERVAAQVSAQVTRAAPTLLFSFSPIPVRERVSEFLTHHEVVRRLSIATIRRVADARRSGRNGPVWTNVTSVAAD